MKIEKKCKKSKFATCKNEKIKLLGFTTEKVLFSCDLKSPYLDMVQQKGSDEKMFVIKKSQWEIIVLTIQKSHRTHLGGFAGFPPI